MTDWVKKTVRETIVSSFQEGGALNQYIERMVAETLERRACEFGRAAPHKELSKQMFWWCVAGLMREDCPSLSVEKSKQLAADFMNFAGLRYGDSDYDWTFSGAETIAQEALADV